MDLQSALILMIENQVLPLPLNPMQIALITKAKPIASCLTVDDVLHSLEVCQADSNQSEYLLYLSRWASERSIKYLDALKELTTNFFTSTKLEKVKGQLHRRKGDLRERISSTSTSPVPALSAVVEAM